MSRKPPKADIHPRYYYRESCDEKPRWIRGKFNNWTPGGALGAGWYAVFVYPKSGNVILIPEHCLTEETIAMLPAKPEEQQEQQAAQDGR
jgi:hypothetical protein